jgi:hypothetical protein
MRAKEFISEDRQKLDEVAPLAVAGWALTAGTAAWQAYDTWKDIERYNNSDKTEADWDKLKTEIGADLLTLLVGGVAGKVVGKTISIGATPFKAVKNIYNARKQAAAAKQAAEKAKKAAAPPPGTGLKKDKTGQLKSVKTPAGSIGATTGKLAKNKKSKGDVSEPAGAAGGKGVKATLDKYGKKVLPYAAGALVGKEVVDQWDKADQYKDAFSDYFKAASKYQAPEPEKTGKLVYTSPTPGPTQKFDPGGLGLKGEKKPKTIDSKTMDSNSPVPTAKDPKLPKQNTTSLSTQQGVK